MTILYLGPLVGGDRAGDGVLLIDRMLLTADLDPLVPVDVREPGVALDPRFDVGDEQLLAVRQQCRVDRTAADDPRPTVGARLDACDVERLGDAVDDLHAGHVPFVVARNHDARPARQWPPDGVVGAPTHDYRTAHGCVLEVLQIRRQVPRKVAVAADDPVEVHCDDHA